MVNRSWLICHVGLWFFDLYAELYGEPVNFNLLFTKSNKNLEEENYRAVMNRFKTGSKAAEKRGSGY